MSFFNKVFASVGIGAAKVDTRLHDVNVRAGEEVQGIVAIKGGKTNQEIAEIYLSVMTAYVKEADDKKYTQTAVIAKVKINEPFVITPDEHKEIPFRFVLPEDTPVTYGKSKIWIHTGLDIKNAVDPSDQDALHVHPGPVQQEVFNALGELGFQLRNAENEAAPARLRKRLPFVQEFEFYPYQGPFQGKLDELEVVFTEVSNERAELVMEIDRRAKGLSGLFSEMLEMDETSVRLSVSKQDLPQLRQILLQTIQKFS
ncbi:sporulation protein SpoOM [Bacillus sp. FJAT-42376]|uniref:sporulation protein n=1 Tax=Bacillus sp. FJAT-42376 TaxID=2014076 RepID=UPI000F4FB58C|nr:sporulation protein [Bacillus sp. FJAT-42376]AZB43205.1 sporulation protein SpoOM [Bacillus sp. FJAT-42376]